MKTVTYGCSKFKKEDGRPKYVVFSTNPDALHRYEMESKFTFSYPDCEVYCDDKTYDWIKAHETNGVLSPDEEELEMLETFNFYKEILFF